MTQKQKQIERCRNDLRYICEELEISFYKMTRKGRTSKKDLRDRKRCVKLLRNYGYSYPVIGAVMRRDFSTILYLAKKASND